MPAQQQRVKRHRVIQCGVGTRRGRHMVIAWPACCDLSAQGSEDVETAGASEAPVLPAPVDSAGTLAYLLIHCASCRVANEVPVAASEKAREFTVQGHTCREYSALPIDTSGEPFVVAEGLSEWSRPPPEPPPASALVPPKKRKKDVPRPADKAAENEQSEDDVEDAPEAEGRDGDDEDEEDEEDEPLSKRASASVSSHPPPSAHSAARRRPSWRRQRQRQRQRQETEARLFGCAP